MTNPDYGSVLADLRAKRDELDALIKSLERFAGDSATEERIEGGASVPSDAFFQMSTADAIRKFLGMSRRPQTTKQVAEALEAGGFIHESKNFFNMIYTALVREERKGTVVQLPDKAWGLAERYPRSARQKTARSSETGGATEDNETPADESSVTQFPSPGPGSVKGVAFPSQDPDAVPPVFVGQ